jgi:hypothetical protein
VDGTQVGANGNSATSEDSQDCPDCAHPVAKDGRQGWGTPTLPKRIKNWSLTSLQQRLVKTGGRLVKHARYYWLLLAEGHLTRRRFGAMQGRIALLPLQTG